MSETTLKFCPFCGSPGKLEKITDPHGHHIFWQAHCTSCDAKIGGLAEDPEEMIAEWNQRTDGWVDVNEQLPEETKAVLIYPSPDTYDEADIGWYTNGVWECSSGSELSVTHWMPLPPPPVKETNDDKPASD